MLFHTWIFLVFMLVVLPVYFGLGQTRLWLPWLLVASYFFYGWWNPLYLLLILYSTALDYAIVALMDRCPTGSRNRWDWRRFFGLGFERPALGRAYLISAFGAAVCLASVVGGPPTARPVAGALAVVLLLMAFGAWSGSRRTWLFVSVANNLSLLFFFKYAEFFRENLNALLERSGAAWQFPDPSTLMPFGFEYLLPVGISFYTFQSMSYTIDFYLGKIDRERSFIRFATFVSFFPQLVAGPIERSKNLLPQFERFPTVRWRDVTDGLSLFVVGLFKKVALANYLSFYVERVYENPDRFDAPALLLATFAFSWQIYFDFSGYTDMARGVARVMGFQLMLNFNNPYLATSLGDFWSRWHISLSTWFRDYVYVPLGGSRLGSFRTYRNLFLTFLISAVWHGAAWTFVVWGLLHAIGTLATRRFERSAWYRDQVPRLLKQLGVFCFVSFAWIYFRADTMAEANLIVSRLLSSPWTDPQMPVLALGLVALVWLYQVLYESRFRPVLATGFVRMGTAVSMLLYLAVSSSSGGAFIYFQF